MISFACTVFSLLSFCAIWHQIYGRPTEQERVQIWHQRNNTWPPIWQPESEKLRKHFADREKELLRLPGADERWENYMQFTSSRMVPRFTEQGFDVIQTPAHVQEKLKKAFDQALLDWDNIRNEAIIDVLYTPIPSKFINLLGLDREIHQDLLPLHEEWAGGMKLIPTSVYGIRANRNGSSLVMHYDKIETHVISSIVHIAHEYDNDDEPWPIEIEDHDGVLHAVNLEAGQMLFYESSSCLHGRRQIFKGKYYASIFMHYKPADDRVWDTTKLNIEEVIANVPPHWMDGIIEEHGNRHAGQGLTIDSRVSDAAPPRMIRGQIVENIEEYYNSKQEL